MSATDATGATDATNATDTTDATDARRAQLAAIDESGWGQPFRFVQPHNVSFWVYLVGVGAGLVGIVRYFGQASGYYDPALASGALLFGIYLVPWLLLLRHHNRFTSQPGGIIAAALAWGGFAATFWIALPANSALLSIWAKVGGPGFADSWAAGLTAPINEEWGKAVGLVLLLGLAPRLVRGPYDGFILGAYIGLGFEVVEDVLYAFNAGVQGFGNDQVGAVFKIFLARGLAGIASHALFSAIFCAGLMWVLTRIRAERNVVLGVALMLLAMVFHFAWDDLGGLSGGTAFVFVLWVGVPVIELVGLFWVLRRAAGPERAWIRAILQPEVDAGVVDPALVTAVGGLRRERKAYRWSVHSRRAARHRVAAAQDLAQTLAESRGEDTDRVRHARAEVLRIEGRSPDATG